MRGIYETENYEEIMGLKKRNNYTCPLELTHDVLKGKWKPIIIWQLGESSGSLAKLERSIVGISRKMLIQHLNELLES